MTALAGIWKFGGGDDPSATCGLILRAQQSITRKAPAVRASGEAALGCSLYDLLPEDIFDAQPYEGPYGGWILVADARVDNRDELLDRLGLRAGAQISDSELLFRGYAEWQDRVFNLTIGDFAVAIWDSKAQSLTLARDPSGQRPLHYRIGNGFVAIASTPQGLHALREIQPAADSRQLALFVSDVPLEGPATYYEGLSRVQPGHVVKINRRGAVSRPYWIPPDGELRYPRQSDYEEAFREQLDRATRSRMRGSNGAVAAHLSAGLDSSAVAATAARVQPDAKVIAFTSAPRKGFDGPVPAGRIGDESGPAAETAAMHPNMEHVVLRSAGISPIQLLERDACLYQQPLGNACNHSWWSAVNEAVRARGISIVLTGENGNLTISAGGLSTLADFIRTGRWIGWWREAAASVGGAAGPSWRGVLASSFLPWLPQRAWLSLSRLRSARARNPGGISLLRPEWQAEVEPIVSAYQHGGRPDKDSRRSRWRIMQRADAGNLRKGALGRWGIDERDPTSDRRLAEFCFSLPPDQLLGGGINRRLARMALSDRLPRSVLHGPRGYQYADWYRDIDRAGVEREIARLEEKLRDSSIVDLERLRAVAISWPTGDWAAFDVIQTYRMSLLHALAAAEFQSGSCQSGVQQSLGIGGVAGSPAKP